MSSPSFKPPTSTSSAKDSPTTIIFNSLSPIQLNTSRPSCQAFDNVDVPSPQPVFSTPQNCLTNSKRCKRFQALVFPSPPKIFRYEINHASASLEYPDLARQNITMPSVQSKIFMDGDGNYNSDHHSQDRLCRSPSNVVEEYLSIPSEDCENSSGSSGILLGKADELIHDEETIVCSSNVDPMACPSDFIPPRESSSIITNSLIERTEHLDLVSIPNMQTDKVIICDKFQNNSIVHEGSRTEFLVINNGEKPNLNVFGQNSSCQLEKNPGRKKATSLTKSTALEGIRARERLHGKKPEENFNSFRPSVSSGEHEDITLDRSDLNVNIIDHGDECPSTSSSYLLGRHDANLFSSRAVQWAQLDCIKDAKHETLKNTRPHTNHHGISVQARDASAKSQIPYDQEDAFYHSRCMYKRLQFENIEKRETRISDYANHMQVESSHFISETTVLSSNTESLHVSNTKTITASENVQPLQSISTNISCNSLVKTDTFVQSRRLSTPMVPRSSGIGLHLNAIGVPGQKSSHIDMEMPMEGLGTGGKTCLHDSCLVQTQVLESMEGQVPAQLVSKSDDSSFGSKGEFCSKKPSKPPDSIPNCVSPLEVKSLVNDHHTTPCSIERLPSEGASKSEDSTQTSHGKKRRKVSEIEGQKRCNCKRSKCLKLYCDCFAAGLFCNEACACQGCSNNSEHEEMVSSTKQLIETRNPLAFAPKVVHAKGDLKENGENKHITPPSARHKRGCNCKKSRCLKKYCECYQAGVGCSLGCRCEECKNAYGTKDECSDITERVVEHQKPKDDALFKEPHVKSLEVMHSKTEASNAKQFNRRFNPVAPLVQSMNPKGGPILHLCASLQQPSPESNFTALSSLESPTPTMYPKGNSAHSKNGEEPLSIICNQQFDFSSGLNIDSLSPPWNGFAGLDHICPPSGPSPTHCGSSSTSKTGQVTNYEGKFVIKPAIFEPDYNLSDESPEILREVQFPINTVKVSSPNKKRVSPPQKKLLEAGSSFSPGLKSGRKYVLHSISQFPSLTPYRNNLKEKSNGDSLEEKEGI